MRIDLFDDASNLAYVAAYLVKDIFWLRILSIGGSLMVIPYFLLQPEPLWTPLFWAFVFIVINAFRTWQIFRERQSAELTSDEEALYNQGFSRLSSQQFRKLSAAGTWRDLEVGQMLQSGGDPGPMVTAVASGKLEVSRNGKLLGSYGPGDLLGACLFEDFSESLQELLDSRVVAPARVLQWDAGKLKQLTQSDPELEFVLDKLAGSALVAKLIIYLQAN